MPTAQEYRSARRRIQYYCLIYNQGGTGGPGSVILDLTPDVLNLVWQRTLNLPAQCAFTLPRGNRKIAQLAYQQNHICVFREEKGSVDLVFQGKVVQPDHTGADTVIYCYDYLSYLQRSRTGYRVKYTGKKIGTEIVSPEWALVLATGTGPLNFVATGTIEDPLAIDNVTPITTNTKFGVNDFDRLFLFNSLAEMAMANTSNLVKLEITRSETAPTFNFWKNKTSQIAGQALMFPGNVSEVQYSPAYASIENDLASAIQDVNGATVEYVVSDAGSIASYRRLQAAVTIQTLLGLNANATQNDQQKAAVARLLAIGTRIQQSATWFVRQGELQLLHGWDVGDTLFTVKQLPGQPSAADEISGYSRIVSVAASWGPGGEQAVVFTRELD